MSLPVKSTSTVGASRRPIRVLVVDDSPTARELLIYLLASDQEIQVIGTAKNGADAIKAVQNQHPDLVTMDLHMPQMDGFEATRAIMESSPVPIVIVTGSLTADDAMVTFSALEAGALALIKRPLGLSHPDFAANARELIQTVKLMSEVKVVKRWQRPRPSVPPPMPEATIQRPSENGIRLVAIGASTGGPLVLQQIFSQLDPAFAAPIIAVQHITTGFVDGFTEWLNASSHLPISIAKQGEQLLPAHIYIAPSGMQTTVERSGRIRLLAAAPENGHLPSVSCLFRSVATAFGSHAIGVLLTGMGRDGAVELGEMKSRGAITIAQDKASSVVHGMPGEAIRLGAASYILPADRIAAALENLIRPSQGAVQ